jgi:hypothetical protein
MVTPKLVKTDTSKLSAASETLVRQIEARLRARGITHQMFADRLDVSQQRATRILNYPGNMTLDVMLRLAGAAQMKLAFVLYDPPENDPVTVAPEVFREVWEQAAQPTSMTQLRKPKR